jgi:putative membrane protein (TIGR04086 family)
VSGGYVAGRMARTRSVTHGVCVGIGVLLVTLMIEALSPDPTAPLWFNVVSFIGVVPAATMGGRLAQRSTESDTSGRGQQGWTRGVSRRSW